MDTVALRLCSVLFVASLAAASCGKGGGVFAFDQRAHIETIASDLPQDITASWRRDGLPRDADALKLTAPEDADATLRDVALAWFEEHHWQRALVDPDGALTEQGTDLLGLLHEAHDHALPVALFQLDAIAALQETLRAKPTDAAWAERIDLPPASLDAVADHFRGVSRRDAPTMRDVAQWLAHQEEGDVADLRKAYVEEALAHQQTADALEWLLTLGWLHYVDEMRAKNPSYWDEATLIEVGLIREDPNAVVSEDESGEETVYKMVSAERLGVARNQIAAAREVLRRRTLTREVEALRTPDVLARAAALEPPFEQYQRLKAAFRAYRQLALAGGWDTDLSIARDVGPGARHAQMPALRRRLAAEGIAVTDLTSTTLDADLVTSLKVYQHTHQFDENGKITPQLVGSMNRSPAERIAEIAVAMQGWRDVPMGRDATGYRIQINVPDFHAEVWDNEELLSRFRVVVGRHSRDGAKVNTKTPLFSESLSRIVLNPYWNVPQSIIIHELIPKAAENPLYYEEHNYEVRERGSRLFVRQRPGPGNALGRVKFLFPNEFAVYMHDTPSKSLFGRTVRAFSHGCIRVQDPMNLAELLISRDRGWDLTTTKRFIERALRQTDEESYVNFEHPLPVHIYYVGVQVDDQGRPHFLADIYRDLTDTIEAALADVPAWLAPLEPTATP